MSLLTILFGLAVERYVDAVDQLRKFDWTISFADWVKQKFSHSEFWNDTLGLIVIILLPMFLCAIIYNQLNNALGLLGFLFSLLVLVYCMGPKRIQHTARLYIDAAEHSDEHSVKTYAIEILGGDPPGVTKELNRRVCEKILVSTNENLLGVFFWFVLLGPMGALMFRMANVLYCAAQHQNDEHNEDPSAKPSEEKISDYTEFNNSTRMLYAILLWLPAQLTTLAFAITGSFIDTLQEWKQRLPNDYLNPHESEDTLFHTGLRSLQIEPDTHAFDIATVQEVLALSWRSIILWITVLALLTLAGWAG
ncbi:MAG TPA: regulatory signaling modulator protein AmpE [Gammaproteobacteria bacterium]